MVISSGRRLAGPTAERNESFPRALVPGDIGRTVRDERRRRRWSQARLAEKAKVHVRTIVRLEAGDHVPNSSLVHALEHILGFENRGLVKGWKDAADYDRPGRGEIARRRRLEIGLTLEQVAELAGVSAATLSRFERALADPVGLVDPQLDGLDGLLPRYVAALRMKAG